MPRKKRSEKRAIEVARVPVVAPARAKVTERLMAALCPVCGRTVPEKRALKIGNVTIGKVGYFDSIDWDENKPFGVSYLAAGRGSFKDWEHIGPEEAPELFEALKARLIQAVGEWINKGWLTPDEIRYG